MLDVPCVCVSSDEVTNTQRDSHCFEIMEHTLAPFYGHHSFGIFIQNVWYFAAQTFASLDCLPALGHSSGVSTAAVNIYPL